MGSFCVARICFPLQALRSCRISGPTGGQRMKAYHRKDYSHDLSEVCVMNHVFRIFWGAHLGDDCACEGREAEFFSKKENSNETTAFVYGDLAHFQGLKLYELARTDVHLSLYAKSQTHLLQRGGTNECTRTRGCGKPTNKCTYSKKQTIPNYTVTGHANKPILIIMRERSCRWYSN